MADPFEKLQKKSEPQPLVTPPQTAAGAQTQQASSGGAVASSATAVTETGTIQTQLKKGSKLSPRLVLIGCGIFFMLFLGLVRAGLFYALQSAQFLRSVGLAPEDVKNILIIFAVLFFGLVFFAGFYVLILNVYRLATVKGSKIRYVFGLLGGIIVIAAAITLGTLSIMRIRSLVGETRIITDDIILPHVQTRDSLVRINQGVPLIAPVTMRFQVSKDNYAKYIANALGQVQVTSFGLDCGNGQIIEGSNTLHLGTQNGFFADGCLYTQKGIYQLGFIINYYDRQTGDELEQIYNAGSIEVTAEIGFVPLDDEVRLNDKKNELIVGTAPITLDYRAQLLFSDLGLNNNTIQRDLDGDKKVDKKDNSAFQFQYRTPKLYNVYYRLPGLEGFSDLRFQFGVRVLQSELPACTLTINPIKDKERGFSIQARFDDPIAVQRFVYTVFDVANETYLKPLQTDKELFEYVFPQGGAYEVNGAYFTTNGKKGSCDMVPVQVGYSQNRVDFDVYRRQGDSTQFIAVASGSTSIRFEGDVISSNLVPVDLQFHLKGTSPDENAKVKVFYNGTQIFPDSKDVYELALSRVGTGQLEFRITPSEGIGQSEKESIQTYTITTTRKSVVAAMKVEPSVGEDPLEVTLDASISPLYDENDEIVYFTWNYGDGESQENISQGKVTHIYRFDTDTNKGEYFPSVTIKTKLGAEDTYRVPTPIIVKRKQQDAIIYLDSHPTQQAKVNDLVKMSVESDGMIKSVSRDFGNGRTSSCTDRGCISTATRFEAPGEYTIKATVEYEHSTPATANVKIRVFE